MIVNLTQITLTPELIALGVCDLSPNFFKVLGGLLTEKSNWDDFTYIGKKLASFAVCGHNCGQSPTHALVSGDLPDAVVGVIRKELSYYGVKLIKVNNDNISYTFPGDCPVPALCGVTLHGGKVVNRVINKVLTEVVAFDYKVNGQPVCVRIAGKPELEAAVAAIKATEAAAKATARAALEAAVPGLAAYEAASVAYSRAAAAYDRASEHGYPAREAAAAERADQALQAVFVEYPATKAWSEIQGYTQADNYSKSAAGDAADKVVRGGGDVFQAAQKMRADWAAAAERAVFNS